MLDNINFSGEMLNYSARQRIMIKEEYNVTTLLGSFAEHD